MIIIMYRTAVFAEAKKRYELVTAFNSGTHFVDDNDNFNSYSKLDYHDS